MHELRSRTTRFLVSLAFVGLGVGACGGDPLRPELVETAQTTSMAAETSTTLERAEATTTTTAPSTTAAAAEPTTVQGTDDQNAAAFPGEPLDFGPQIGTGLAIVGVEFDGELNFRRGPSPDADIAFAIAPLSDDLDMAALGEAWAAPAGVWWKVSVLGEEVWANQAYLGSLGAAYDGLDEVGSELGVLKFENVEAAARAVAETRASDEPESRIVLAGEPLAFEIGGFAIVDVLDLGDDAVKGERIRIDVDIVFDEESGEEGAQDIAFVVVTNVDITPICGRGTADGLCA